MMMMDGAVLFRVQRLFFSGYRPSASGEIGLPGGRGEVLDGSIALEAERRMGELLKETERAKPPAGPGRGKVGIHREPTFSETPTLAALGVSKKESAAVSRPHARGDEVGKFADLSGRYIRSPRARG
jgi:hypothetical protein